MQKGPKQDGDSYYMVTRMPVAWWWLPVQEHPGDMEVTRAWQVMGAIHDDIATTRHPNGDVPIKDDNTGETLPLELQPPADPASEEGTGVVLRLHRSSGAGKHGRVLRHRTLFG